MKHRKIISVLLAILLTITVFSNMSAVSALTPTPVNLALNKIGVSYVIGGGGLGFEHKELFIQMVLYVKYYILLV